MSDLSYLFPDARSKGKLTHLLGPAPANVHRPSSTKEETKEGPILNNEQAYILRAAAIDACELIVHAARAGNGIKEAWVKTLTLPELNRWLCAVAKDREDYRILDKFVLTDTVFF
jgi:hypothetical protein